MKGELQARWTMKELAVFLKANPLGIDVYKGDSVLIGKDYIFLDFTGFNQIGSDDGGVTVSAITINVYCRNYSDRDTTVKYLLTKLFGTVEYTRDEDNNYFVATLERGVFVGD